MPRKTLSHVKSSRLIFLLLAALLNSGCMTIYKTSSYDGPSKSKADLKQTNFHVTSVSSAGTVSDRAVRAHLTEYEETQNRDLVPVPYEIRISEKSGKYSSWDNDFHSFLSTMTLFVWPRVDRDTSVYDVVSRIPGVSCSARGKESTTTIMSWLVLPVGIGSVTWGILAGKADASIDFRSGTLESRLAKAAFNSLTKERYDAALVAMTEDARRRLLAGDPLSKTDERLLDGVSDSAVVMGYAKHPDDLARSREALSRIDGAEELADIALNAGNPKIRKEAAERVSGLPEDRFTGLVSKSTDASVGQIFLSKISNDDLLRGIVQDDFALTELRSAALGKIREESTLIDIAKTVRDELSFGVSAVNRIQTESALADVAGNATLPEVRLAAIRKIDSPAILFDSVIKDSSEGNRLAALARIADPSTFAKIVRESADANIRLDAIKKVDDQRLLSEVSMNDVDKNVRHVALSRITDSSSLAKIVRESKDVGIRLEAVKRVSDQSVLGTVAQNDSDEQVRLEAILRLDDCDNLRLIAENDSSEKIRATAVKKVTDSETLGRIARNDPSPTIRLSALSRVNDSAVIQDIVANDSAVEVRSAALERIADPAALGQIARTNSDEGIRLSALARIDDETVIREVSMKDKSPKVRIAGIRRLEEKETLNAIVIQDASEDARLAAIQKVDDSDVLAKVAKEDFSAKVRLEAVRKISDSAVLVEIARKDPDPMVKRTALSRIDSSKMQGNVMNAIFQSTQPAP